MKMPKLQQYVRQGVVVILYSAGIRQVKMPNLDTLTKVQNIYCRVSKVSALLTSKISDLIGRLLLRGAYYRGAPTIEGRLLSRGAYYRGAPTIEGRLLSSCYFQHQPRINPCQSIYCASMAKRFFNITSITLPKIYS